MVNINTLEGGEVVSTTGLSDINGNFTELNNGKIENIETYDEETNVQDTDYLLLSRSNTIYKIKKSNLVSGASSSSNNIVLESQVVNVGVSNLDPVFYNPDDAEWQKADSTTATPTGMFIGSGAILIFGIYDFGSDQGFDNGSIAFLADAGGLDSTVGTTGVKVGTWLTNQLFIADFDVENGATSQSYIPFTPIEGIITYGSEYVFNTAQTDYISCTQIDTNKIFIAYKDVGNNNYGTAVVATISGNTITYGTEYVFKSLRTNWISCTKIDTNKIFIGYTDDLNDIGYGIVAEISGTDISYGTENSFNTANSAYISCAEIDTNKVFISYRDVGNSNYETGIVANISGNTITYGSEFVSNLARSDFISCTKIDTNKVFIGYEDVGNTSFGTGIVATISGNIITYGSEFVFNSANSDYINCIQIDTDKVFISYRDVGNSNYGTGIVATISGTNISYGTEYVFNTAGSDYISCSKIDSSNILIGYRDDGNSNAGTGIVANISGNTITYGTEYVFNTGNQIYISCTQADTNKHFIAYHDDGNGSYGTGIVADIT